MLWEDYTFASTPANALEILTQHNGEARLIAGGTDLMFLLRDSRVKTKVLVDLCQVEDLKEIKEADGSIKIGSLVTHDMLAASPVLLKKARVISEAARSVGSPQIRNVGTIGGNVVNAQPAADTSISLMALDAKVSILTENGEIEKPLQDIFVGPGKSAVDPSQELVTCFSFAAPGPDEATAFARHARRKALSLPILNVGVWLKMDSTRKTLEDIRIAMGPMAAVPFRASEAESLLKGKEVTDDGLKEALEKAAEEASPRDSFRGSANYKKDMVKVFLKRAILSAVEDLRGDNNGR